MFWRWVTVIFVGYITSIAAIGQQSKDSLFMRKIGHWDDDELPRIGNRSYNDIWGYADDEGKEYAIIGNVDSIFVFDVTDPGSLTKVYAYSGGSRTTWRDFKTYGNRLYAVSDNSSEGLLIFNLETLPDSLTFSSQFIGNFTSAHNIFIDTITARLYVAGSNTLNKGLIVYDLAQNPDTPSLERMVDFQVELNDFNTNYYVHDVFVRRDTAYCSHGYTGYYLWDFTDIDSIELIGNLDNIGGGYNHSSWITEDGLFSVYAEELPFGRPLTFVDISDPTSPVQISTYKEPLLAPESTNNVPHNPFILGDKVYSSYYEDGVVIVDISDIFHPSLHAFYDTNTDNTSYHGTTSCWGVYPFLPSGNILASDIQNGLFVLELDETIPVEFYADSDGDGFGNQVSSIMLADHEPPAGYVSNPWDCNDADTDINPNSEETCDEIDNNCDGIIDEECNYCDFLADELILDQSPISPDDYEASLRILSAGLVANLTQVTFQAGQEIILNPGFLVETGAVFIASVESCDDE